MEVFRAGQIRLPVGGQSQQFVEGPFPVDRSRMAVDKGTVLLGRTLLLVAQEAVVVAVVAVEVCPAAVCP